MTQAMQEKLRTLLHANCFMPTSEDNSITLAQSHHLAVDGITPKRWTQELTITGLEGDEIFFSFDWDDHQYYSRYIIGQQEKCYAKACDYIMLKKVADKWYGYIGELKMKNVCKNEVDLQTKGTQAFLEYIQSLLKLDGYDELNSITFIRKVISSKRQRRASQDNRNRPVGRVRRRPATAISFAPETGILSVEDPYNQITATKLMFNDEEHSHQTITLDQFLARA